MKSMKKGLILISVLMVMIFCSGFVSASENITADGILSDDSSQNSMDEIGESSDAISQETSKIDVKDSNAYYKEKVKLEVYVKDSNDTAISNRNVSVYFNDQISNQTTDGNGKIILSYNNLKPNTYKLTVKFDGDENFTSFEADSNVKVKKAPLAIKMSNFNTYYKSGSYFKAKVYNKDTGNPVSGIRVLFKVYSYNTKKYTNYYATTDSKGVATLKKNLRVGTYKISTKIKDSKNKKYITYKNSKNKVTMKVKSLAGEDCCSFFLQVSNTESVGGFRRDNTGMTTITVKEYTLGGIPVVRHTNAGGFVHLIVFANGWIVGNGGLDSGDFINSMQELAVDMVKSNKIKRESLEKIYRYKRAIDFGHFSIKAPDGRYAVVWKNHIITGKLKPGEFSCSPNFKEYYRHSTYKQYSTNPAKAAIKVGSTDHYGVNRRQVVVLHWKATTNKNFQTYASVKAYAANDDGRFVGVSSGGLVDNVVFKGRHFSAGSLPRTPSSKYLGTHSFGNVDKYVKVPTIITAPSVSNKFNTTKYFKVTLKNKNTNKALSKTKFKIKLTGNGKTKVYTLKTDIKGVAKFNTKNLAVGKYSVVLSPATNKYLISGKSKITIK
jgi:hypothetical protein